MVSVEGDQIDPGGAAGLSTGSRGFGQKIKDWTRATIAEALAKRDGRTSLKVNGAQIGVRQHLDVQMSGATGEDHPELDLARVVLTGGGGSGALVKIAEYKCLTTGDRAQSVRLPATGTIGDVVANASHLLLVGQARTHHTGGGSPAVDTNVWVNFNDETHDGTLTRYSFEWVEHSFTDGILQTVSTNNDVGIQLGYCPSSGATGSTSAGASFRAEIPDFNGATFNKTLTFQSMEERGGPSGNLRLAREGGGYWHLHDAITSIQVFTNETVYEFDVGTVWTLYALADNAPAGGGGGVGPLCVVYLATGHSLADNTPWDVSWDAEDTDTPGWHDLGTHPERITVDATGWYDVRYQVVWDQDGFNPKPREAVLQLNGAHELHRDTRDSQNDNHIIGQSGSCLVHLSAGDYLTLQVFQLSGFAQVVDGLDKFGSPGDPDRGTKMSVLKVG